MLLTITVVVQSSLKKEIRIESHRYNRLIRVLNLKKGARKSVPNLSHPNTDPESYQDATDTCYTETGY